MNKLRWRAFGGVLGWVRKGRQGFRLRFTEKINWVERAGWTALGCWKGAALTRIRVCSFSYLFLVLFYFPPSFFCFLLIWISFCYQGMLSLRLSWKMPWTVNESYKHLITGLVLHEAGRGGLHFQDISHIHSNQSFKVKYYWYWWVSRTETLSSISHLQHTNQIDEKPAWTRFLKFEDSGKSLHFFSSDHLMLDCSVSLFCCLFCSYLLKRVWLLV